MPLPDARRRGRPTREGDADRCARRGARAELAPALLGLRRGRSLGAGAQRLELALADLRDRGVRARGDVGDANPILAIADALADFPATEIVIATDSPGRRHWLERGLIAKARARFDIPITQLGSSYGRVQDAAAA